MVFDSPGVKASTYLLYDSRECARADYGPVRPRHGLAHGRQRQATVGTFGSLQVPATPRPMWPASASRWWITHRCPGRGGQPAPGAVHHGTGPHPGKLLAFVGARSDIPGVDAAEIAVLDDVVHANGRSTLVLRGKSGLQFSYQREGLRIHANVVAATHGEGVQEVLGNGDASQLFQQFTLRRPPTTHLSAASSSGAQKRFGPGARQRSVGSERPSLGRRRDRTSMRLPHAYRQRRAHDPAVRRRPPGRACPPGR